MSPAQLRQHAANRFLSANKQEWSDTAVELMRAAADRIKALELLCDRTFALCCSAGQRPDELDRFMLAEHHYRAVREANPLLKPCQDLIAFLDKNPPMGESIYAVRQIREAVAATVGTVVQHVPENCGSGHCSCVECLAPSPVVQHLPADDTEGGAL